MHSPPNLALLTLAILTPLVTAHGKIALVTGDAGGNTTALGILGGIVPGPGKNSVTEIDTTVFRSRDIASDGLGKTTQNGDNKPEGLVSVMQQSGETLPQVSECGGRIEGLFHVVTTDGAGPVQAIIDPSATGAFSVGVQAYVITNVPGNKGRINSDGQVPRSLDSLRLSARALVKRAANVNMDFPIDIVIPAGMRCAGEVAGKKNVCFLKIANSHKNGPFGGVVAFQMAGAETAVNVTARGVSVGFRA